MNTGVNTSEPRAGRKFDHQSLSQGPVGEFEGVMVITWEPKEKAYKAFVFGDSFPATLVETGQWESDALVYRTEFLWRRHEHSITKHDEVSRDGRRLTSDQFSSMNGSPETFVVHVNTVKNKFAREDGLVALAHDNFCILL